MRAASRRRAALCVAALAAAALSVAGCAGGRVAVAERERMLTEARTLLSEGRALEAVEKLRVGLGRDRHQREGRLLLAEAYRSLRTIEARADAEKILEDLRVVFPGDPGILRGLADLHVEQGYTGKARREYRQALGIDSLDTKSRVALGMLYEASWLRTFREDEYAEGRRCFERTLEIDPADPEARLHLCFGEMEHGNETRAVVEALKLIESHPDDPRGHLLLGSIYARRTDYVAAKAEFDKAALPAELLAAAGRIEFLVGLGDWFHHLDRGPLERDAESLDCWMQSDPTPASEMNERRICHEARLFWSDLLYGSPRLGVHGWETAPGEMYVRYGPPVKKEFLPGSAGAGGLVPPSWVFTYDVEGEERTIVFEDLALSGRFYFPMSLTPTTADFLREERPNEVPLAPRAAEIAYATRAWQFRGEKGATRVDYYVDAPEPPAPERFHPRQWGDLTREIAVFDSSWKVVERRRENFADGIETRTVAGYRSVALSELLLAPGAYRLASEIEDLRSGAKSGKRESVRVQDFSGAGLRLSDIVLGREAEASARPAEVTARLSGATSPAGGAPGPAGLPKGIIPDVEGAHVSTEPLAIYFEIYNLQPDLSGTCRRRATYTIFPASRENDFADRGPRSLFGRPVKLPPHISQSFDERGADRDVRQLLRIDASTLPPDDYRLELHVIDLNTGIETRGSALLRLVKRTG